MKQVIALKLLPTPEQAQSLRSTMEAFNAACNYLAGLAFEHGTANKYKLQELGYKAVREQFGLSSQLTVRAIAKTCEAFKRDKAIQPQFRPHGAITYDARLMSFKGLDTVSLLTLEGRALIKMIFGQYQAGRMDRIRGQADLIRRNGQFYLYATVELPEPPQNTPTEVLGIDLGVTNIAVDSDGQIHSAKTLNSVRVRYARLRRKLQKKGTKPARRLLKKRRRKEQRFAKDVNHCISKKLVSKAKDTKRAIAVEELTGIRKRIRLRKAQRLLHHSWSFGQLRAFLTYKAQMAGVALVAVDPRNTSRICLACGGVDKRNRPWQAVFRCIQCEFVAHADTLAAMNIAIRGWAACHAAARLAA
jgi:IS605 OrfB family transposase